MVVMKKRRTKKERPPELSVPEEATEPEIVSYTGVKGGPVRAGWQYADAPRSLRVVKRIYEVKPGQYFVVNPDDGNGHLVLMRSTGRLGQVGRVYFSSGVYRYLPKTDDVFSADAVANALGAYNRSPKRRRS
jgi:hypothetical protein